MQAKIKSIQNNILTLEALENSKLKVGDRVEVKKINRNRTISQNSTIWLLINKISEATGQDDWSIYLQCLEHAKIAYEYIETIPEALPILQKAFRLVQFVENRINQNNKATCLYKCYLGSSNFDKNEGKIFIEYLLDICNKMNIETGGLNEIL